MKNGISFEEAVSKVDLSLGLYLPKGWQGQAIFQSGSTFRFANLGNNFGTIEVFEIMRNRYEYVWHSYAHIVDENRKDASVIIDNRFKRYSRLNTVLDIDACYTTIGFDGQIIKLNRPWYEEGKTDNRIVFNPDQRVKFFKKVESK